MWFVQGKWIYTTNINYIIKTLSYTTYKFIITLRNATVLYGILIFLSYWQISCVPCESVQFCINVAIVWDGYGWFWPYNTIILLLHYL